MMGGGVVDGGETGCETAPLLPIRSPEDGEPIVDESASANNG